MFQSKLGHLRTKKHLAHRCGPGPPNFACRSDPDKRVKGKMLQIETLRVQKCLFITDVQGLQPLNLCPIPRHLQVGFIA